jgi:hypothetical protein
MHSIFYVLILTRMGLERFDCPKMTAVDSGDFPLLPVGFRKLGWVDKRRTLTAGAKLFLRFPSSTKSSIDFN